MIIGWIASIVGERAAKPVLIGLMVLAVILAGLTVVQCVRSSNDAKVAAQAKQTTASSDAMANAASSAIATISNRTVTDGDIDNATANAQSAIQAADDPAAIRSAVLAGVCSSPAHAHDPACTVR